MDDGQGPSWKRKLFGIVTTMIFMHPSEECGGEDALAVAVAAVAAATAVRSLFMTYVHTTDRPARSGVHHSVVSCFTPGAARSQRPT